MVLDNEVILDGKNYPLQKKWEELQPLTLNGHPLYLEELSGEEVYVTEWFDCPPSEGKYRFVISDGKELDGNSD